jgi:hypothetical protein
LSASGAIIYAYVGGNPVNGIDPKGLHLVGRGPNPIGRFIDWILPIESQPIDTTQPITKPVEGTDTGAIPEENDCKCLDATEANIRMVLADSVYLTTQRSVSGPVIQAYVDKIKAGTIPPPFKLYQMIIVDGHHSYIAGKLCSIEIPSTPGTISPSKVMSAYLIRDIIVDPIDWGNR